jgi:RNA polymerase sigma factor (sigma-70 family)
MKNNKSIQPFPRFTALLFLKEASMNECQRQSELVSQVRKAQKQDQQAFQRLYHQSHPYVIARISAIIEQFEVVQDIEQEVWLAAFLALPTLQSPETFLAWIGRIATRYAWRWAQKQKIQAILLDAKLADDLVGTDDPLEHILQEEQGEAIDSLLRLATANEREVLMAFYLEELSIAEIVQRSGLSQAAIKSRLHEGRKRLRSLAHQKG